MTATPNEGASALEHKARNDAYNQIVGDARLLTIALDTLEFKVDRNLLAERELRRKFNLVGNVVQLVREPDEGGCLITVQWSATVTHNRKKIVACTAGYTAVFDSLPAVDDELISQFAENFARPATYAYFRALFATLDGSGQTGLSTLPVLKFIPKWKKGSVTKRGELLAGPETNGN